MYYMILYVYGIYVSSFINIYCTYTVCTYYTYYTYHIRTNMDWTYILMERNMENDQTMLINFINFTHPGASEK